MCSRYISWLAYKQRKTKISLTEVKLSHSWTASIIWRPINWLKVQDSYHCRIRTSKFKKLNIIHEVEDHTSSQQKFHPCNILFAKYIFFGKQECSSHSIRPAQCNLLNLLQLRNKDYRKDSTVPRYMYLAPNWTSSFTRGRETLFKIFPPTLILGSLYLWWGYGQCVWYGD